MAVTITADQVKKLRDQTGAGMMDCKAALVEANGDFDEANTILRKRGQSNAAKKAGRATGEGLIGRWFSDDHQDGILVDVNCETDFVARTDDFLKLIDDVIGLIKAAGGSATDSWLKDPSGPVQQRVAAAIAKVGENMAASRFVRYTGQGYVSQYIHLGGKLGVQVEFGGVTPEVAAHGEFVTLAKEVAMQIAAASPTYTARADVPADVLEKEKTIYRAQMEHSGKPANVIEKIIDGKLGAFYEQVVLVDQPFVIRPETKQTVAQAVAAVNKALGASVTISRFARLKVGEGI
ncbi:MAG: translation elongation factor Ts [Acidimicrobiia bacterium]|nr:translation elongation factor Ts [Acidimicrobiia bacterium]